MAAQAATSVRQRLRAPFDRRVGVVPVVDLEPSIGRGGSEADHVELKHGVDAQTGRRRGTGEMAAADQSVLLGVEQRETDGPLGARCPGERSQGFRDRDDCRGAAGVVVGPGCAVAARPVSDPRLPPSNPDAR